MNGFGFVSTSAFLAVTVHAYSNSNRTALLAHRLNSITFATLVQPERAIPLLSDRLGTTPPYNLDPWR